MIAGVNGTQPGHLWSIMMGAISAFVAHILVVVPVAVLGFSETLDLQTRALLARHSIREGEVAYEILLTGVDGESTRVCDVEAAFDFTGKRRLRFDITERPKTMLLQEDGPDGSRMKELSIRGNDGLTVNRFIIDGDDWTQYCPDEFVNETASLALVVNRGTTPSYPTKFYDPRLIGFTNESHVHFYNVDLASILTHPKCASSTVSRVEEGGAKFTKLECARAKGVVATVWISEEKQFAVTRIETVAETSEGPLISTMNAELQEWQPGIWFPKTVRTGGTYQGKPRAIETIHVKSARFGPVDPDKFSLKGLEIRSGTPVIISPGQGETDQNQGLMWDGEEVVPADVPLEVLAPSKGSTIRLVFAVSCGALALMFLTLFFRARRRKI